jgi:hypothetical protein
MTAKPLALEGFIEEPRPDDGLSGEWRRERQRLEDEARSLRREVEDLTADKQRLGRSVENLRRILGPIHNGLRALFGEIELAIGEEMPPFANPSSTPSSDQFDPRWESYKKRFTGVPSKIIDALLIHGEMQITPLAKLIGRHPETTRVAASKLKAAGALQNSAGMWSLKR